MLYKLGIRRQLLLCSSLGNRGSDKEGSGTVVLLGLSLSFVLLEGAVLLLYIAKNKKKSTKSKGSVIFHDFKIWLVCFGVT